jgi:hypothetical protein
MANPGVSKNVKVYCQVAGYIGNVPGLKRKLTKATYGTNTIGKFFREAVGTWMREYVDHNVKVSPKSVAAITYSLGEVAAEFYRTGVPLWTGSLQQAVVFDVTQPIGSTRTRRYTTSIHVGLDLNETRYERGDPGQVQTLRRLGGAINSHEPIVDYEILRQSVSTDANAMTKMQAIFATETGSGIQVSWILLRHLRQAVDGAWAFIESEKGEGILHGVIRHLDEVRAQYVAINKDRLRDRLAYRIERVTKRREERKRKRAEKPGSAVNRYL